MHLPISLPAPARTKCTWRAAAALLVAAGLASSEARASDQFSKGSLIIPTQSAFQGACGTVSVYGLIFKTLQANDWLVANGYPRITVYWVYAGKKKAPNLCVPTNADSPKSYYDQVTNTTITNPPWTDANWNSGCDFSVTTASAVPVMMIDPTQGNDTTKDTYVSTISASTALAYPTYPSHAIGPYQAGKPACNGSASNCNITTVQYMGGAFVIKAEESQAFLSLLQGARGSGGLVAKDGAGNNIDFSPFSNPAGSCYTSTVQPRMEDGRTPAGSPITVFTNSARSALGTASDHHVNIHRAMNTFTAETNTKISAKPPTIALLTTAGGAQSGNGVTGDMLPKYLDSAGLNFTNAAGCPAGSYNRLNFPANCAGNPGSGQIFDVLDVLDIKNGLLNSPTLKYQVLWTPHWEGSEFNGPDGTTATGCDANCIQSALTEIGRFADGPHGIMAECASIGVFEGNNPDPANWWYPFPYSAVLASNTQFLTCIEDPANPGSCAATQNNVAGVNNENPSINSYGVSTNNFNNGYGQNPILYKNLPACTNPDAADGVNCVYLGTAGNPYAQIGDFNWFTTSGYVSNFVPSRPELTQDANGNPLNAKIIYKPGATPLSYDIANATLPVVNGRAVMTADNFTFIQKDGNTAKSQILYLGGHDYSAYVSGTRVVLNTLLNLGQIPQTQETGFASPTIYKRTVYAPTYDAATVAAPPAEWKTLDFAAPERWIFPYHRGHLRAHPLASATAGQAKFTDNVSASAELQLPAPGSRNIFTYLGGQVTPAPAGLTFRQNIIQNGWKPVKIAASSIADPTTCLDVSKYGSSTAAGSSTSYNGLVPGSDGVCDLEQAVETMKLPPSVANFKLSSEILKAKKLLQMVRGFCYAESAGSWIESPTSPTQCKDITLLNQNNTPFLGGFVRSQAAIVGPSSYIQDAGGKRPTVAYIGGLDGMLHAFYIPNKVAGVNLDNGYTGPANGQVNVSPSAETAFSTALGGATGFVPPNELTELWAFIPPGELPRLDANEAVVDASPAVIDVFDDFEGKGFETWHTVLVSSAGGDNREIFALDVTNPLKPVLLWDIDASFKLGGSVYWAPVNLMDKDTVASGRSPSAIHWQNRCRHGGTCTVSNFFDSSTANRDGPYNYSELGASLSVSAGRVRTSSSSVALYAAFVATNEPADSGFHIYGIHLATGQKLWEFDSQYETDGLVSAGGHERPGIGNNPPPGLSLYSARQDGLLDYGYAGDDEGHLWEFDLRNGKNRNAYQDTNLSPCGIDTPCNLALSDAYGSGADGAQPISTQPTVFILPDRTSTAAFLPYAGQAMIAYGTGGTGTVEGLASPTRGMVHLFPLATSARYKDIPTDMAAKASYVRQNGVSKEVETVAPNALNLGYPIRLNIGEHMYGALQAVDGRLYYATSIGYKGNIDQRQAGDGGTSGYFYQTNLVDGVGTTSTALTGKSGAASAVDVSGNVVTVVTILSNGIDIRPPPVTGTVSSKRGSTNLSRSVTTPLSWFFHHD